MENKSIIGKMYIPRDNSYSVNLSSSCEHPYENKKRYLAGYDKSGAKKCKIISEPFKITEPTYLTEVDMIVVKYGEEFHTVMYREEGIVE